MGLKLGALAVVCGAIALSVTSPSARADVTTPQSITVPLTETNFGSGGASGDPLTFNQFDPTLGALQSVQVTMAYNFNQSISMQFTVPSTITVSAGSNLIAVERPDGTSIVSAAPPDFTQTQSYGFAPGQTTFPQSFNFGPANNSVTLAPVSLNSTSDLALFTGSGTVSLPLIASAVSSFTSSSGNGFGQALTEAGATVSIQYDYTPKSNQVVPEPSSLILLGLGGGGLFWGRRLRSLAARI